MVSETPIMETARSMLLQILTACPVPTVPQCVMFLPIISRTARALSKSDSLAAPTYQEVQYEVLCIYLWLNTEAKQVAHLFLTKSSKFDNTKGARHECQGAGRRCVDSTRYRGVDEYRALLCALVGQLLADCGIDGAAVNQQRAGLDGAEDAIRAVVNLKFGRYLERGTNSGVLNH